MDRFLKHNSAYNELWKDYYKHGRLVVGYDFDNTVYDHHNTGESFEMVRQLIRDLKEIGSVVICWTANEDLDFVESFLTENNIPCDGINIDVRHPNLTSRKVHFDAVLDDKAGLTCVYYDLSRFVREFKRGGY